LGAIAQFGGQTPSILRLPPEKRVNIIGTSPQSIEIAEDRKLFAAMLDKLNIPQPPNGLAVNEEEALAAAKKVGYPVLVRPSFVLGGRAMQIVYSDDELRHYMRFAVEASPERPVLVDKFLEEAIEVDVDCIADIGIGGTQWSSVVFWNISNLPAVTPATRRWSAAALAGQGGA